MVTQEHLETLERDGVVHIPGVLSPAWVEYLRACTDWQIEHPHVWAIPGVASGLYDYIQVAPAPGCADEGNGRAGRREGRRRETEADLRVGVGCVCSAPPGRPTRASPSSSTTRLWRRCAPPTALNTRVRWGRVGGTLCVLGVRDPMVAAP